METIWTPLTLSLPDARSRTFPARAIFLAYQHGHVSPDDGRLLTEKALTFFIERFKSPLGGVLLGEVFLSPVHQTAYAYRGMLCEDEARLDTLEDFIKRLRLVSGEAQLGVHLHASTCERLLAEKTDLALLSRLSRLFSMIDWIECDLPFATHLMERLSRWWSTTSAASSSPALPTLCVRVGVRPSMTEERVGAWRDILIDTARASNTTLLVHVHHAEDVAGVHMGGSERASALLGKIARWLITPSLEAEHDIRLLISGRIKHSEDARRVLDFHGASLVGMSRALLAEPAVLANDLRGEMSVFCMGCMACVVSEKESLRAFGLGGKRCVLRPDLTPITSHPDVKRWLFLGASYTSLTLAEASAIQGHEVHMYTLGDPPGGMLRLRGRTPGQAECAEVVLQRLDQCKALETFHMHTERLTLEEIFAVVDAMREQEEDVGIVLGLLPRSEVPESSLSLLDMLCAGSSRVAYPSLAVDQDMLLCVRGSALIAVEGALFLQMQGHRVCIVEDEEGLAHDTHEVWGAHYEQVLRSRKIARVRHVEAIEEPYQEVAPGEVLLPHAWEAALIEHIGRATVSYRIENRYEPFARLVTLGARRVQSSM